MTCIHFLLHPAMPHAFKTSVVLRLDHENIVDVIASTLAIQMAIASLHLKCSLAPTLQNLCLTDYA
jgi:hypothetical protein